MSRPTVLTIDLAALKENLERVRFFAPQTAMIAMVKANAYGHGIVRVAEALSSAEALGVASIEEGISLRDAGVTQPIVLMEGLFHVDELRLAAANHFTLVVHHEPHIRMLEESSIEHQFPVWLKMNTGMNRLGVPLDQAKSGYERLMATAAVKKPVGLMTHFAEADVLSSQATVRQLTCFNEVTQNMSGPRSLANSAAILSWPKSHGDWVRPGLMLYGASPIEGKTGLEFGLKPVMTLTSRLIAVNSVKAGEKVGYGGTWTAPEDMLVGIVGVGYGDGYPQFATNGTPILVNGVECHLAGRVSMDMLAVDLRYMPQAQVGDEVTLWGRGLPVEKVAKHSGTSAYEILTRMTPRPKVAVSK
jgi:alanine racemase